MKQVSPQKNRRWNPRQSLLLSLKLDQELRRACCRTQAAKFLVEPQSTTAGNDGKSDNRALDLCSQNETYKTDLDQHQTVRVYSTDLSRGFSTRLAQGDSGFAKCADVLTDQISLQELFKTF